MKKIDMINHARVHSLICDGLSIEKIKIEVKMFNGLYDFTILGISDNFAKESKARIRAAIRSSNFSFPNKNVMVAIYHEKINFDIKTLDLPIIIAILMASQQIKNFKNLIALGEVELSGLVRVNDKLLDYIYFSQYSDICICPFDSSYIKKRIDRERRVQSLTKKDFNEEDGFNTFSNVFNIYNVEQLKDLDKILNNVNRNQDLNDEVLIWNKEIDNYKSNNNIDRGMPKEIITKLTNDSTSIFSELININSEKILRENLQFFVDSNVALRTLKIALCGYHSLCLIGDIGCGKTMLAKLTKYINYLLIQEELKEAKSDEETKYILSKVPFIEVNKKSTIAQIRGGERVGASIFSKAKNGFVFCDELLELSPAIINHIKEQLSVVDYDDDSKKMYWSDNFISSSNFIDLHKNYHSIFISTANPCKCGKLVNIYETCTCQDYRIKSLWSKLSNSFIDRIEIWHIMQAVNNKDIHCSIKSNHYNVNTLILEIFNARNLAKSRAAKLNLSTEINACLNNYDLYKVFSSKQEIINSAIEVAEFYKLSIRSFHNLLKLTLSISDINNKVDCDINDFYEAVNFRLDRTFLEKVGLKNETR